MDVIEVEAKAERKARRGYGAGDHQEPAGPKTARKNTSMTRRRVVVANHLGGRPDVVALTGTRGRQRR
jgi:hypothetical protein